MSQQHSASGLGQDSSTLVGLPPPSFLGKDMCPIPVMVPSVMLGRRAIGATPVATVLLGLFCIRFRVFTMHVFPPVANCKSPKVLYIVLYRNCSISWSDSHTLMQHLSLSHSGVPFLSGVPASVLASDARCCRVSFFARFCWVSACYPMLSVFGCQSAIVFYFLC